MKQTLAAILFFFFAAVLGGAVDVNARQSTRTSANSEGTAPSASTPSQPADAPSGGKREHTFNGTVEKVDANTRMLTVNGENVPGWMGAMMMNYRVDKPEAFAKIKTGDRISAKVYDGDFSMLHDVRVVMLKSPGTNELPPLSYACPTPGEDTVFEDKPGKCPQSGATLVPVRLVVVYSCLKFTTFIQDKQGVCPVDRSDLVPITAGLYFTCKGDSKVRQLEPGTCADGSARIKSYERRPHGDHNPRHGGQFFMAEDNWHHLEGTFVRPNTFNLYFYNDFTRPLAITGLSATIARTDADGKSITAPVAMQAGRTKDRNTFVARMPGTALPANFEVRVKFKPNDKEHVFDFAFADFSREPTAATPVPGTSTPITTNSKSDTRETVPQPPPAATFLSPTGNVINGAGLDASSFQLEAPLPTNTPELLAELAQRAQTLKMMLDEGNLGGLWNPALRAKDVALALEEAHANELPEVQRPKLASAVKRLTLAAWQIDAGGDLGNKELLLPLYQTFSEAIADIQSAYGPH